MPVTSWNVKWYEGTVQVSTAKDGTKTAQVNLERQLNDNDTIAKDKYLIAVVSVSGYSATGKKDYYKVSFSANANAVDNGQTVVVRPKIYIIDNNVVIDEYDPKVNGESVEFSSYPYPFSQYGETDTITFASGPFEGDAVLNYDVKTGGATAIVYEAEESTPGPAPTAEEVKE